MNIKVLFAFAAMSVLAVGCSDKKNEDPRLREQDAMDAWMAANHPEVTTKMDNGMYVEWLRRTNDAAASPRSGVDWVSVDYLVRDLDGNIVGTRDPKIAADEETYTRVTRYVPDFAKFDPALRYFTPGEYRILSEMKVTDSVRLYLPSNLAYINANIVFANGYEGWQYSVLNPQNEALGVPRSGRAVIIDLALREIVADPAAVELAQVEEAAEGMTRAPATDSKLYYEIVEEDPEAEVVAEDKSVWVIYVCRLLDGTLIATNDGAVANAAWGIATDLFPGAESFAITGSSPIPGSAFNEVVKRGLVRFNSTIRMVYTSDYGYGAQGAKSIGVTANEAPRPVVFPYTPLILEVTTMPKGYSDTLLSY